MNRAQVSQRDPDGAVVYRGLRIVTNPNIRAGKLGRYSVEGVPFAQLVTAKEHVDRLHRFDLVDRDELV